MQLSYHVLTHRLVLTLGLVVICHLDSSACPAQHCP
jgi:hypothetical protein